MRLHEAMIGQSLVVCKVHMREKERKRLFYIGIYPGAVIEKIRTAPFQDPCLYFVAGNQLIMRNQDASCIEVEVKP